MVIGLQCQQELNKLKELFDLGFIFEEEFAQREKEILDNYGVSTVSESSSSPPPPLSSFSQMMVSSDNGNCDQYSKALLMEGTSSSVFYLKSERGVWQFSKSDVESDVTTVEQLGKLFGIQNCVLEPLGSSKLVGSSELIPNSGHYKLKEHIHNIHRSHWNGRNKSRALLHSLKSLVPQFFISEMKNVKYEKPKKSHTFYRSKGPSAINGGFNSNTSLFKPLDLTLYRKMIRSEFLLSPCSSLKCSTRSGSLQLRLRFLEFVYFSHPLPSNRLHYMENLKTSLHHRVCFICLKESSCQNSLFCPDHIDEMADSIFLSDPNQLDYRNVDDKKNDRETKNLEERKVRKFSYFDHRVPVKFLIFRKNIKSFKDVLARAGKLKLQITNIQDLV